MQRLNAQLFATLLIALAASAAGAHPMTERFIPIGQSPGVSGTASAFIGTVESLAPASGTLTLRSQGQSRQVRVTGTTNIWLDRSASGRGNVAGSLPDVQVGRRAEVRFGAAPGAPAQWIKVQVD